MQKREPFTPFAIRKKSQLITASDLWFKEVAFSYRHERHRTVLYLGGFVIECLLKASLWDRRAEADIGLLLFRSHDLEELLNNNAVLRRMMDEDRAGLHAQFVRIASWNVRFRYNPQQVNRADARRFMRPLEEVRQWLRSRA